MERGGPGVLLVDDEPHLRGQLGAVLADYGVDPITLPLAAV